MDGTEVKPGDFTDWDRLRFKWRFMQFLVVLTSALVLFGLFCDFDFHHPARLASVEKGEPYRFVIVTRVPREGDSAENHHTLTEKLNRVTQRSRYRTVRQARWWAVADSSQLQSLVSSYDFSGGTSGTIWNLEGDKVSEGLESLCFGELIARVKGDENGVVLPEVPADAWSLVVEAVKPDLFFSNASTVSKKQSPQLRVSTPRESERIVFGVSEKLIYSPPYQAFSLASLGWAASVLLVAVALGFCCRRSEGRVTPQ